jgi:8-oxo-dGTP pyrophosphatase MutT (NUDIX family)
MNILKVKNIIQNQHTLESHEWEGAVLFLFNSSSVFFIKRALHMPSHPGQVGFIGGHKNHVEKNPWQVAEREFQEETSLTSDHLHFCGYLSPVLTAHHKRIVPVMAELKMEENEFHQKVQSNGEWDFCFSYPWSHLCNESAWNFGLRRGKPDEPVLFFPFSSKAIKTHETMTEMPILWGATALIVWRFLRLYYRS